MKIIILTLHFGRIKYTSKTNLLDIKACDHIKGITRVPRLKYILIYELLNECQTLMTGLIKVYMPYKFLTTKLIVSSLLELMFIINLNQSQSFLYLQVDSSIVNFILKTVIESLLHYMFSCWKAIKFLQEKKE